MGKKVESYQSNDGVLFDSEEAMMTHEATTALAEEFPELRVQIPFIMAKHERIAEILYPLHVRRLVIEGTHAVQAEGTHIDNDLMDALASLRALCNREIQRANSAGRRGPQPVPFAQFNEFLKACDKVFSAATARSDEEPEDRGGCDCSASMAGNGPPHHPTCPMYRPVRFKASDKPRLSACPPPVSAAGQPFPARPTR